MAEPVDVLEGRVLEAAEVPPWSFLSDGYGLAQTDDRRGHSVVVGVRSFWRADACRREMSSDAGV